MTILIFGATGSAGGSVLRLCLATPEVKEVRAIVRRPIGVRDPRLREFIHSDYLAYSTVSDAFERVDACFYCLGISATQVPDESQYRKITHDFALAAATELRKQSPNAVFHYVSGRSAGLNSRFMWARVKAETERDLMERFTAVCWRPAAIDGMPSASEPALFKVARPVLRLVFGQFRSLYVKGEDIGRAMLQATREGVRSRIVENSELRDFADAWKAEG